MVTEYNVGPHSDDSLIATFFDDVPGDLKSLILPSHEDKRMIEHYVGANAFKIRLANTQERRESASVLVNKMYSWRGYDSVEVEEHSTNSITLTTSDDDGNVIATISIGIDSEVGLCADESYRKNLEGLRDKGRRLCEFTRLAVDSRIKNKRVLASLFHIAYLYPWGLFDCTDGVLEVNPRHVKFYQQVLGFKVLAEGEICSRVNAPSVLLSLDFNEMTQKIKKHGGQMDRDTGDRTLFPYCFTYEDSLGILNRLRTTN